MAVQDDAPGLADIGAVARLEDRLGVPIDPKDGRSLGLNPVGGDSMSSGALYRSRLPMMIFFKDLVPFPELAPRAVRMALGMRHRVAGLRFRGNAG